MLFIDEAYSLLPSGHGHDFAAEALSELIVQMETARHDLAVVLAGYPAEIDELIRSNPGIASRLAYRLHFADFTRDELLDIARREMERRQYQYDHATITAIRSRIIRVGNKLPGNARDIRTWVEQAIHRAAVARRANVLAPEDFAA
ncbi:MAG: Stage V sporulation protein K [Firmicutes bacterium]|nr:Stage V sporulation protein K [candidate division NPL-UPA2 bacterium]